MQANRAPTVPTIRRPSFRGIPWLNRVRRCDRLISFWIGEWHLGRSQEELSALRWLAQHLSQCRSDQSPPMVRHPILANWKVGYIGGSVLLAAGALLVILPTLRAARVRAWTPQRTVRSALTRTAGIAGLSAIVLSVWLGQGAIGFSTGYLGLVFIVGVIPAIGVAALGCALANWFARSLPRTVGALAVWIVLIVLTIAWPLPEVVEDHSPGPGIEWQE